MTSQGVQKDIFDYICEVQKWNRLTPVNQSHMTLRALYKNYGETIIEESLAAYFATHKDPIR